MASKVTKQFATISEEDLCQLENENDTNNTKRVIRRSVLLFRQFLKSQQDETKFESFPKEKLNSSLRAFYASVRKNDGSELKKSSLQSIKYGIGKYLRETCNVNIKASEFRSSATTFKSKIMDLKKKGRGSIDHKSVISHEDLRKLHSLHNVAFNMAKPFGLQNYVWFNIMYFLCRKGQENLREMTKDMFAVDVDTTGRRFVYQIAEEANKNHNASSTTENTIGDGRMYESDQPDDPWCPYAAFEKYISKLNTDIDCLWQRPLDTYEDDPSVWYSKFAHGKNFLARWMAEISYVAGLSKRYTNHCIRATMVASLDVSGHKSLIQSDSKHLLEEKQRVISDTLARLKRTVPSRRTIDTMSAQTAGSNLEDQPKTMRVKEEPVDPEYERTAQRNGQASPETSSVREQLKQMVENKGEELTIQSVIENLLQNNEFINTYKPQTNTASPNAQEIRNKLRSVLQPKDPTASCSKEDVASISEALVEVDVTEPDSGTDTDLVCAVSSKIALKSQKRQTVQMDITVYWCNFCSYKTDKKEKLLEHGLEHRFHCKYCKFQSFSRAATIKHSVEEHPAFAETGSNLKYCSCLPDILQRHEVQKRKASDSPSDDTIPSKKPRNDPEETGNDVEETNNDTEDSDNDPEDSDNDQEETNNDTNETVLTLKMEVEEVQDNKEEESSTVDKVIAPKQTVTARTLRSTPSSKPVIVQLSKLHPIQPKPKAAEMVMPVITNVISAKPKPKEAEMVMPVITNVISGEQAVIAATGSTSSVESSVTSTPPATSTPAPANGTQGPNQLVVSSGLCWNCGYCGFVTLSQSFLKLHLNAKHQGQAHKYVAMLVSSEGELEKIKASDHQISQNPGTTTLIVESASTVPVVVDNNSPKPATPSSSEPPKSTEPPSEPFGIEIDNAELGVQKEAPAPAPAPEEDKKVPLSYKCAHCNFTAPASDKVKSHLFQRHNGCVMYSLDMRAVKLGKKRYVFFCMKSKCSFETKEVSDFLEHSEACTPWLDGGDHPDVEKTLIKSLEMTKKFVLKTQKSTGGQLKQFRLDKIAAEYNCIYCSFVSNNNTRLKKHVLSLHVNKSCVIRDLLAAENKRKPLVYFCKHCLWETRTDGDLMAHLKQVHKSTSPNTVTPDTIVNSGSSSSTTQDATNPKIEIS